MRPLSLTMSAFGPYAGTEVIPMEKLGTKGLYLITGDTGSGKTTIFDGISFALYGEASGDNRDGSMLRSKYAEPETPTNVELVFELRGRKYTVKRNPEYMRPKTRGEGFTSEKASAELCCDDGRIVTGNTRVTEAVTELLGLDRRQFSQIAMIAQGDFLKLLLAPTDERKKIFRKLFHTEKYARLQDMLRRAVSECSRELDLVEDRIRSSRDGIGWKEPVVEIPERELPDMLAELMAEEEKRLEKMTGRREELEKALDEAGERLRAEEQRQERKEQLEALRNKIVIAEGEMRKLRQDEAAALTAGEDNDRLREEISQIKGQKDAYSELDDKASRLGNISGRKKTLDEGLKKVREDILKYGEHKSALMEERKKLEESIGEKPALEKERDRLISRAQDFENLINMYDEWEKACEAQRNVQNEYMKKAAVEDEACMEYNRSYRLFLNEQAGIMAENLEEGRPCPVCGSLEHPEPAEKGSEAPSEAEVERLRSEYNLAANKTQDAHGRAKAAEAFMEEKRDKLIKKAGELLGDVPLERVREECLNAASYITGQKKLRDARLKEIEAEEIRYGELMDELPGLEDNLERLHEEERSKDKENAALTGEISVLTGEVESLSLKLSFPSLKEAEEHITALENTLKKRETEISRIKSEIVEKDKELAELKGKADSFEDGEDEESVAAAELTEEIRRLKLEKKDTDEIISGLAGSIALNRQNGEKLMKSLEEAGELRSRLSRTKALSDAANGNVTGREKVMLETYVQGAYFDRIIRRANLRLMEMTGGQYELRRSAGGKDLRSITGLELDVADHYNGSTRSVRTLSGGESFKASLSLALGLADEIQSSAGGIRLDTMFIDEGFGSLDGESLSQAIGALADLGEGDRLVGIISHVDELKNRINRQLVVTKGKSDGSHVSVILD